MDVAFLIVVAFALGLVSVMMTARLRSAGVSLRRVVILIVELWAVFALWAGVLWATATKLVPEGGLGSARDIVQCWARFLGLSVVEKVLTIASLVLGLAIFIHFNWALRVAMQAHVDDEE